MGKEASGGGCVRRRIPTRDDTHEEGCLRGVCLRGRICIGRMPLGAFAIGVGRLDRHSPLHTTILEPTTSFRFP